MPPWKNIKLCFGPCDPNLNLDLIDRRKIIFEPVNPIATITTTAYLFLKDGKITGVQDASISADGIDLSAAISPGVRSLLGDAKVLWAHPVESGNRSRAVGSNYLFAALPKAWDTTSTVAAIGFSANGQVELLGNVNLPPQGTTPPTGTIGTTSTAPLPATTVALAATGPTPRVAAAPVLSATERALYLVGGEAGETSVGDVWRFDLITRAWSRLKTGDVVLERVLAATYDPTRGKLVVLDEIAKGPWKKSKFVRFTIVDTRSGNARVAAILPRAGLYDQIGLSLLTEGEDFALVGQRDGGSTWNAFRFTLTEKDDIRWTGSALGLGELFDVARATPAGVKLRVRLPSGAIDTASVAFWPSAKGCDLF